MGKVEEREFHDRFVTDRDVRSFENRFYSAVAEGNENDIALTYIGDLHGKRLLFYGSGGHFSLIRKFAQLGAEVIAIDISPETVALLKSAIEAEGLQNRATAAVMDCESLDIEDASIDVVVARSIIHHLDVETALREIHRVLKPSGKLTALEPLGTNPFINLYRWFTPASRTTGEHPFVMADVKRVRRYFPDARERYLYCLSLLAYLYRMVDGNERRFATAFSFLNGVDNLLVKCIPPYRYLCWEVLLCCQKTPVADARRA
jgi:SAM-dependent methyltransferase